MDEVYIDFERLFKINDALAFFIVRAKTNFSDRGIYSNKVAKSIGIRYNQIIKLTGNKSKKNISKINQKNKIL